METNKIVLNGKEMTIEELNKAMAKLTELTKLQKAAKAAGVIATKEKKAIEKPKEYELLKANLVPFVEANADIIAKLFANYAGQDSVSLAITKKYSVIIRDMDITKEKQKANKDAKKKAAEAAKNENPEPNIKNPVPNTEKPVDIEQL